MEKDRILYHNLTDMIDQYIDQVGITKASADILRMLSIRLYDKLRIIGPALEKEENESITPEPVGYHSSQARKG